MGIYILVAVIGAVWSASVAHSKNNNVMLYAMLGFAVPLIGVLAAHFAADNAPEANA